MARPVWLDCEHGVGDAMAAILAGMGEASLLPPSLHLPPLPPL